MEGLKGVVDQRDMRCASSPPAYSRTRRRLSAHRFGRNVSVGIVPAKLPEKRKGKKDEPDYHNLPFIEIVVIDKPFAKIAARTGALEGLRDILAVRTSRKSPLQDAWSSQRAGDEIKVCLIREMGSLSTSCKMEWGWRAPRRWRRTGRW